MEIPGEAIQLRQEDRIRTLADRFLGFVNDARNDRIAR